MKIRTLSLLALAGMSLSSAAVYSLTPPGGASGAAVSPEAAPAALATAPASGPEARFSANAALALQATLGNDALLRADPGETYLLLEVRGVSPDKAALRAPVNLALVIDRSGSMKGSRLQNAKQAARAAVDRLQDGDTVSVLSFDTKTTVVVPPTEIDARSRPTVAAGIESMVTGGDTCISCGIEDGMGLLDRTEGRVSRMIVLSDGDATAGVRDIPGFRSIAQRARDRGVSVTTVGVNVDYNERILSAIAEESNGQHYFVEDEAALSRALDEEAQALTRTVASETEAVIELAPGVALDRVYDRSFRRADRRIIVPLGTFSRDEAKTVLLKLRVSPSGSQGQAGSLPVAGVELDYRDLTTGTRANLSGALAAKLTDAPEEAAVLNPVVLARVQRSETASALSEANALFLKGRIDDARRKLDQGAAHLDAAARGAKKTPSPRGGDADNDFKAQEEALNRTRNRFERPPSADPSDPFEATKEGKGAVRETGKSIFDMRR